jgi:serine/threonine protein kinase
VRLVFVRREQLDAGRTWDEVEQTVERHRGAQSPFVVETHLLMDLGKHKFAVTEDLMGTSVQRYLKERGRFPLTLASQMLHDLAQALMRLHAANLVHGTWLADHVRLGLQGRAKLVQDPFAMSAPVAWDAGGDALRHQADFAAPELANPRQATDPLTDVYALGCIAYMLVTGSPPFAGGTIRQKLEEHANQRLKPFSFSASPELIETIHFMMAKRRDVRLQSAAEVAARIAAWPEYQAPTQQPMAPPATRTAYVRAIKASPLPITAQHRHTPVTATADITTSSNPLGIQTATESSVERLQSRRQRSKTWPATWWIAGGMGLLAILVAAGLLVWNAGRPRNNTSSTSSNSHNNIEQASSFQDEDGSTAPTPDTSTTDATAISPNAIASRPNAAQLVDDDQKTLWQSPTQGEPLRLDYTPQGAQMILAVRLGELLKTSEGTKTLQALGPLLEERRTAWEQTTSIPWDSIERVIISWLPQDDLTPHVIVTAWLAPDRPFHPTASMAKEEVDGGALYRASNNSLLVPTAHQGTLVVWGSPELVSDIAAAQGAAPVLRLDLEKLRDESDADQWACLLVAPNFVSRDGRGALVGKYSRLISPLDDFLQDEVRAAMLSVHWTEDRGVYLEARLRPRSDVRPTILADRLRAAVTELPMRVESYLGGLPRIDPYWRRLALRYNEMLRCFAEYSRIEFRSDQVVMTTVLPPNAPHNLVLATELALVSDGGVPLVAAQAPKISTLEQLLQTPITFSVQQQSLEFAMRDLASETNDSNSNMSFQLDIRIQGSDLQQEGITRNQQIRQFSQQQVPLADVLTGLVMRANPITTVTSPTESDQKLVWYPLPMEPGDERATILITTRAAATQNGYQLPPAFGP